MFSIFIGKNISPLSGIDFFHLYFTHKSGIINSWQSCWVFSLSVMSNSLQPHVLHVTHQAPLYMGFSRQGYWSGLPFPPPRDLPNPEIEPRSSCITNQKHSKRLEYHHYYYLEYRSEDLEKPSL